MFHNYTLQLNQTGGGPESLSPLSLTLFAGLMSLCITLTISGNILVVLSVFTYKPLRVVQNFYIVSLAVADLAVAILVMPFHVATFVMGYWHFGAVFCNMWLTFDVLMCTASILNLCAIAVDRYYAIHDPINYAQKRTLARVLAGIFIVWMASAIISIPPLIGWNNSVNSTSLYDNVNMICKLTDEKGYVIYSASGSFYIPLVLMAFVYFNIYIATRARLRARAANGVGSCTSVRERRREVTNSIKYQTTRNSDVFPPESQVDQPENYSCEEAFEGNGNSAHNETPIPSPNVTPARSIVASDTSSDFLITSRLAQSFIDKTRRLAAMRRHAELRVARIHTSGKGVVNKTTLDRTSQVSSVRSEHMNQFLQEKQRISLSKERRAARTMAIIIGAFILCWLPFFLMYVIFPFCESCRETNEHIQTFIVWLGYINSSLNPIIYTVFNIDFRRAFKALLQCKCSSSSQAELRYLNHNHASVKSRNPNHYT